MVHRQDALDVLKATSRTFAIPILRLPSPLQDAVASAYLCMRSIDQIEDHPHLDHGTKARLLRALSLQFQAATADVRPDDFRAGLQGHESELEEVTVRVGEWALLAPASISARIWDATAAMADRMAYWSECNWRIKTRQDLDRYTFSVAGAVGLLLSDLWAWYDNTQTNRLFAIGFGRGLQSVNILRNREEDLSRGVDFFPEGWSREDMTQYARYNLSLADQYNHSLPKGPALDFCEIPLTLAHATLHALSLGKLKLSRSDVMSLIEKVMAT